MIKLFFILLLHVFSLSVVAQNQNGTSINEKYKTRLEAGKKEFREADSLRNRGERKAANEKIDKAKDKFKAANNYANEQQKNEVREWLDKCNNFSKSNSLVSSSNKWTISWDEENQCIKLKSGNQTECYRMVRVECGTYGEGETILNFSIGETEVTELLWNVVMKGVSSKNNMIPKTNVSWTECNEFIDKLNAKTGILFRLPEANEWEFAASGGNKTKGFEYAGSNDLSQITNLYKKLQPVKKYKANELELYDMTGNVYEWTSTQSEHGGYILKGGSFREANINGYLNKKKLKISDSEHFPENDKQDRFGFRIVKSYE